MADSIALWTKSGCPPPLTKSLALQLHQGDSKLQSCDDLTGEKAQPAWDATEAVIPTATKLQG